METLTDGTKVMTEEELRAIADSQELEGIDIPWFYHTNKTNKPDFIGKCLFDYDQGFSILNKENVEHCLTGVHGPAFFGGSNYIDRETYHLDLSIRIDAIKTGKYRVNEVRKLTNRNRLTFAIKAICSFT